MRVTERRQSHKEHRRMWVLVLVSLVVLAVFVLRLVQLQLIEGESWLARANNSRSYSFQVTAARGDIVDAEGVALATNTTGYSVVLNNLMRGDTDLNELLYRLVTILQDNGEQWRDNMPVSEPDASGQYRFTADEASETEQNRLANLKKAMGLQNYATPQNVMDRVVEVYDLQEYSPQWQRILGGIRYQMQLDEFSNNNNYTLAASVSQKTMAVIKEHSLTLPGVEIVETSMRSYPDGTILPHVLGSVSAITREQWLEDDHALRRSGYQMSDLIGQSGLEAAFESYLKGTDGTLTITANSDGEIQSSEITEQPQPGQTVQLTINADFQSRVQQALENRILTMRETCAAGAGAEATAGAVVVLDVKTFGVLAAATYPSYDLNLYSSNYSEYASDENLPLYNRAFLGLYSPGSSFKPAVAASGLTSGLISADSTINCSNPYSYYDDYQPRCLQLGHSGPINVTTALRYSCNIFFYDLGRRLGLSTYDDMAYRLGLAGATGLEVKEATGQLTTEADSNYSAGLVLQAAIGQGNTLVTPVQLATYAATLANNGTRLRTHLVSGLIDSNTGEVVQTFEPEVVEQINDDNGAFETIREGMIEAAQNTRALSTYPIAIAAKTGSPQRGEVFSTSGGSTTYYANGVVIAYAPADDPQIAVAAVVEYGGGGSYTAPLVTDVLNEWFYPDGKSAG